MHRRDILNSAQAFFCRAMAQGYASGAEPVPIAGLKGWKGYQNSYISFRLLDAYIVNPVTKKLIGNTSIWYKDDLIWYMSYGGSYQAEAIPLLKQVLLETYEAEQFYGGRGITRIGRPRYVNECRGDFEDFSGEEEIEHVVIGGYRPLGQHRYFGMALI